MTTQRSNSERTIRLDATLDDRLRATLGALADVLIPAGAGFPSASEAGVAGELADQILLSRPDLLDGLVAVLEGAQGRPPADAVADLRRDDPAGFSVLATLVPGAYFSSPQVRSKLGYHGQRAKPMAPVGELDRDLLRSVIARGPIYRPTPDLRVVSEGEAAASKSRKPA